MFGVGSRSERAGEQIKIDGAFVSQCTCEANLEETTLRSLRLCVKIILLASWLILYFHAKIRILIPQFADNLLPQFPRKLHLCQSCKPIRISLQENLWRRHYFIQEVVSCCKAPLEFYR